LTLLFIEQKNLQLPILLAAFKLLFNDFVIRVNH
jgi:hypothetical protein